VISSLALAIFFVASRLDSPLEFLAVELYLPDSDYAVAVQSRPSADRGAAYKHDFFNDDFLSVCSCLGHFPNHCSLYKNYLKKTLFIRLKPVERLASVHDSTLCQSQESTRRGLTCMEPAVAK